MTKNDHSNGNYTRILGAVCHRAPARKMTDMSCVCTCEGLCVYTHCVAVHECVRHEHTHMCMWMSIPVCIMHTYVLFTRVLFMCVHGTCVCACMCKSKCTCIMQNMHVLEHGTLPWPRVVSWCGRHSHACEPSPVTGPLWSHQAWELCASLHFPSYHRHCSGQGSHQKHPGGRKDSGAGDLG